MSGLGSTVSSAALHSERSGATAGSGRTARPPRSVKGEGSKASVGGAYVGYVTGPLGSVVLEVDEEGEETDLAGPQGGKSGISTQLLLAQGGSKGGVSSSAELTPGDPTLKSLKYAPVATQGELRMSVWSSCLHSVC